MNEAKDQARVRETSITAALYNAATDYAAYVTSNRRDYDEVMKLTAALEAAAVAYAEIAGDRQAEAVQNAELKPVRFSEWLGGKRETQLLLPNETKIRFCNALDAMRSHAAEAVDIWNASGSAVLVETQAGRLAKGVMYYNTQDWLVNAMSLVAMFDANHGGVPGHKAPEESKKIHEQARVDAAKAVIRLWGHGPDNGVLLGCLFSAANETEDSRKKKMIELVEYAKSAPAKSGSLMLGAKTCDRQTESVRSAWMPLSEWSDNALESAVKQIKALLEPPASAVFGHRWGGNPMVVRWLTVMRSQQLSAKKNRAGG